MNDWLNVFFHGNSCVTHSVTFLKESCALWEQGKDSRIGWALDHFTVSVWVKHILAMKQNSFQLIVSILGTKAYIVPSTSAESCMANSHANCKASWLFQHRSSAISSNMQHHTLAKSCSIPVSHLSPKKPAALSCQQGGRRNYFPEDYDLM